jgi:hypothetical protein
MVDSVMANTFNSMAAESKLLQVMGFTNDSILEGGTQTELDAGYPTE